MGTPNKPHTVDKIPHTQAVKAKYIINWLEMEILPNPGIKNMIFKAKEKHVQGLTRIKDSVKDLIKKYDEFHKKSQEISSKMSISWIIHPNNQFDNEDEGLI